MNLRKTLAAPLALALIFTNSLRAQTPHVAPPPHAAGPRAIKAPAVSERPKLVVMIVVDQMRGDYVDKFKGQWSGGLKRMVEEGAWFRDAAYSYAATETCVGHATISTGTLPATHGVIANAWWDRETQKMVTCTADPDVKNLAYGGGAANGGDSAWRMRVPTVSDELRFQSGGAARVATFSLKARSAIGMGGHKGDVVTWFNGGSWVTSSAYGSVPFIEEFTKAHPVAHDYGKTWELSLPKSSYLYDEKAVGAVGPPDWQPTFPHALKGKAGSSEADEAFYEQWATSPFADTYLTRMAENAVDQLGLGKGADTDFLGVGYSAVDYVGHGYGPRSWEIQDILVRLDKDLGDLFAHLDARVGRGNYLVALSADHGVAPVPEDMQKTGAEAGVLYTSEVQEKMEQALEALNYPKPVVARISSSNIYFSPGLYERLKNEPAAMRAAFDAIRSVPGVADVYRAEDLQDRPASRNPIRNAEANSYFPGRSGDLRIVPKPYWLVYSGRSDQPRRFGTGHGTPYNYDQRVPILLMGWGIRPGQYLSNVTPADIAPTIASLCGITLATRDGRVLREAVRPANPAVALGSAE